MVTKNDVKNMMNTLPTGYYLGRQIKMIFDEQTPTSFYDLINDEIHVSYKQLAPVINKIDESDLEWATRCMTYHETAHAILTPKSLRADDIMNIFEDERIETLLQDFFKKVNFKKFVKTIADENAPAQSPTHLFYQIVRFRKGPQQFVDEVDKLIVKHAKLHRNTKFCTSYFDDIHNFYNKIFDYFINHQNQQSEQNEQKQNNRQDQQDQQNQQNQQTCSNMSTQSNEQIQSTNQNTTQEDLKRVIANATVFIKNTFNSFDNSIYECIEQILKNVSKTEKQNGSAIHSYSGVFDPRAVQRDDYKYFAQQNRLGHVKQYSKIHLNLFIDNSGSFDDASKKANQLLAALTKFESANKDFDFDLITMNMKFVEHEKNDRELRCMGTNAMPDEIFDIFKRHQIKNAVCYNIVMFDGNMYSGGDRNSNWKAFDHENVTIISNYANEWAFSRCIKAKVIITNDYVADLITNTLKTLNKLTR